MTVFKTLAEILVYTSLLYVSILLFKSIFRNRLSPFLHYAVWFLLVIRFCFPVTIESQFHFFTIPTQTTTAAQPYVGNPSSTLPQGDKVAPIHIETEQLFTEKLPEKTAENPSDTSRASNEPSTLLWDILICFIWICGTGVYALYRLLSTLRFRRKIRSSYGIVSDHHRKLFDACRKELHIRQNIPFHLSDAITTPALTVSWKPALLFPSASVSDMADESFTHAIKHELTHYKRKDHLVYLLLHIIEGIYWFHPVAWLMSRRMKRDIESACDHMVVQKMSAAQKARYARTLLQISSGKKNPQALVGMAVTDTGKETEDRIRRIFSHGKSQTGAKITAGVLAVVLCVACFTTACQPTPESQVVINKGDGKMEEALQQSPSTVAEEQSLRDILGVPHWWQSEVSSQNDILQLHFDAEVLVPDVKAASVAEVSLRAFSQNDLDLVKNTLFDRDIPMYEPFGYSREELQEIILRLKEDLQKEKEQPSDLDDPNFWVQKIENEIQYYEGIYWNTPETIDKIPTDLLFRKETDRNSEEMESASAVCEMNGRKWMIQAYSGNITVGIPLDGGRYCAEYTMEPLMPDLEKGLRLTKEEAAEQSIDIARKIDPDLDLSYVGVSWEIRSQKAGWQCVFTRTFNGIPTAYEFNNRQGSQKGEGEWTDGTGYAPDIYLERLYITIDDQGLVYLQWIAPMKIDSVVNENVLLLPFNELKERAEKQLTLHYAANYDGSPLDGSFIRHRNVDIQKVELSLMRIRKRDDPDHFLLIPVWDFYGTHINEYVNEDSNSGKNESAYQVPYLSLLTLNAIDGTVIDRYLGQ